MGASHSSLIPITRDDAEWVTVSVISAGTSVFTEQLIVLAQTVFDVKFKGKLLWSMV